MIPALALHDLSFGYDRRSGVHGVSLTVQPGDCYGFLGHNGAGKTTVMRLALGLLPVHRGRVLVHGIDALRWPRAARARIGALVERPGFHLPATARRNLAWLARLQGMAPRLASAESARVLELLGLANVADRRVGTFSMGMRQRLGIAQAMLGNPPLLLLDEPTNGLDPEGIADLRRVLQHLVRDEGHAVLLSSHQLSELEGLCTRIGVLREGRMVVEGDVAELRRRLQHRHVVAGAPLPALQKSLQTQGLAVEVDGDRLLVDLGQRQPGPIVRALAAAGDVERFAPEPVTLEMLYLRAGELGAGTAPAASNTPPAPPPADTAPPGAFWRAFGHELRTLRHGRSWSLLLLVPSAVAAWQVVAYHDRVRAALAEVAAGKLFSADGGSGHLATAQALQTASPVLALCLLWLGSQITAVDLAQDTLRNTLVRSVARGDVWLAKLATLFTVTLGGWLAMTATATISAAILFGFRDLEEVTRHGDHQVLAYAADAGGAVRSAFWHLPLAFAATAAIAFAASTLTRRPTRALVLAFVLVLGPELARSWLGERAGWLVTSHLPFGLRDESVVGFATATARGAADAIWPFAGYAEVAPLVWLVAGAAVAWAVLLRRRVG